ncbi:hypothetical protein BDB01DRAFT_838181 [Pilobolus umbonatus]|nr:hypothetical protein BDB01DRAFT_838181 [Pilobolus umbonatus]
MDRCIILYNSSTCLFDGEGIFFVLCFMYYSRIMILEASASIKDMGTDQILPGDDYHIRITQMYCSDRRLLNENHNNENSTSFVHFTLAISAYLFLPMNYAGGEHWISPSSIKRNTGDRIESIMPADRCYYLYVTRELTPLIEILSCIIALSHPKYPLRNMLDHGYSDTFMIQVLCDLHGEGGESFQMKR